MRICGREPVLGHTRPRRNHRARQPAWLHGARTYRDAGEQPERDVSTALKKVGTGASPKRFPGAAPRHRSNAKRRTCERGPGEIYLDTTLPGPCRDPVEKTGSRAAAIQDARAVWSPHTVRKMPRRCNSGMTSAAKSSRPAGTVGNMILNPRRHRLQPRLHRVGDLAGGPDDLETAEAAHHWAS